MFRMLVKEKALYENKDFWSCYDLKVPKAK